MTLPLLLAALSHETPLTIGLALVVCGMLLALAGAWAVAQHRIATLETRLAEHTRDLAALRDRQHSAEAVAARQDQRMDHILELLAEVRTEQREIRTEISTLVGMISRLDPSSSSRRIA